MNDAGAGSATPGSPATTGRGTPARGMDSGNLAGILDVHARTRAGHTALVFHDREWTYEDFAREVRRHARHLVDTGVRAGDLVGVSLEDSPRTLFVLFALARIGAMSLPMDARWSEVERTRLVAFFKPRLVLSDSPIAPVDRETVMRVDPAWDAAVMAAQDDAPLASGPDLPLLVSLSSGTTGRPTGPMVTHERMFARFMSQTVSLTFNAYDRFMTATPLYFGGGRTFSLSQIVLGSTLVLCPPPYSPEALAAEIARTRANGVFLVPTLLRRLLDLPEEVQASFRGLRLLISSGSPLHRHEREQVRAKITPNYYEYYASTEGGGVSVLPPQDQEIRPESVGRPSFRVEVEIVGPDHRPLPAGETGMVRYRGPGVADSFFRDPEASATAFRDGWFYPGDLGALDADGYLTLRGRAKDMINRGGVNIYPQEIEQTLQGMEEVAEACVFPLPHAELGEEVCAALVLRDGDGVDDLKARCRAELASYKVPSRWFVMESLPKNSGGKVVKAEVARIAAQG
ncbi:fatty-acyl-CoA synthase/long-chain acyl-CoA synthetase/malonyl-CoA/methylmalonyl-CoA synthetase [Albimonas donghaensis]|uniref:Fatty-acyl-CoA synthase/long-chain acyl-CoA synthetase/malonyl-CoA/methylmalonyl-CoA synthetase n=2 Tax=Albimonas donghaensis TaxID=356660 RepID=A0A1H2QFH6_9RHOB|nr:fatty-acyl-CoA synthase/long-chain acyl-CoA synthetase/malonyl-CoA/methylmalonyl-CoA synthetase [Albimonas donghaensis]